jgi:hypothetical protein
VSNGSGRPSTSIFLVNGAERWRTTTAYGGDRTDLTPPAGSTATSVVQDAYGRQVALRQCGLFDHDVGTESNVTDRVNTLSGGGSLLALLPFGSDGG